MLWAAIACASETGEVGVPVACQAAADGCGWTMSIPDLLAAWAEIRASRAALRALGFKCGRVSRMENGVVYFPIWPARRRKAPLAKVGSEPPSGGETEGKGEDQPTHDNIQIDPVAINKIASGPTKIVVGGKVFDWAGLAVGLQGPRDSAASLLDLRRADSPRVTLYSTQNGDLIRFDDPEGCEPGTLVSANGRKETIRLVKSASSQPSRFEQSGETEWDDGEK